VLGFYINLPCGGVAAILLLFVSLPHRTVKSAGKQTVLNTLGKLDLIGFSVFAPAAIQFIFALELGGIKYSWNSATVIGLFCGSFGTLLVFLAWEYHMGDEAMIPLSIIRRPVVWSSSLNYACFVGSMLISTYYLPVYFQAVRNATPTLSGVDLLPSIISTILFGIVSGGLCMSNSLDLAHFSLATAKHYQWDGLATTSLSLWSAVSSPPLVRDSSQRLLPPLRLESG
jgi:hypothetical protein